VPETLAALRHSGYRTAVCTNKLQQASETVLSGLDLAALFDAVAGGDPYPVKKPDKGQLLGQIAELGGTAERAVMIGDSENDATAAHAAAMPLVVMRYGYSRVDPASLGADAVLESFSELPSALERLGINP
jgi:phosphoglycolate phosphatase